MSGFSLTDSSGWGDWYSGNYGDQMDWSGASSDSGGSGFWGNLGKTVLGWFGGGSKDGGGSGGNIWGQLLSGAVAGYGSGAKSEKQLQLENQNRLDVTKEQGKQARDTASYTNQLKDFYEQQNKYRKRAALDTYGQFSLMDRYAPNRTTVPTPSVPNYPVNN